MYPLYFENYHAQEKGKVIALLQTHLFWVLQAFLSQVCPLYSPLNMNYEISEA
jgi:hypothetical protein